MRLADHERKEIVGISGSGKSYYVKTRIVENSDRVVIWDPKDEYAGDCDGVEAVTVHDFATRLDADSGGPMRLAVVPRWNNREELCEEFRAFAALVKTARDFVLVVDEVALLRGAQGELEMIAILSRAWGMPLVMVAQRAVSIPKTAREQVTWLVSFRQSSADDIEALASFIGETKATKIAKLPRRQFVQWREQEAFES